MSVLKNIFKFRNKKDNSGELQSKVSFMLCRLDERIIYYFMQMDNPTEEVRRDVINYFEPVSALDHQDCHSLDEEVAIAHKYIKMYKSVFPELYIYYTIEIEESNHIVPALITLPLIQNAFIHGYNTQAKHPIKIKIKGIGSRLWIEVSTKTNHYMKDQRKTTILKYFKHRLNENFGENYTLLLSGNSNVFKSHLNIDLSVALNTDKLIT